MEGDAGVIEGSFVEKRAVTGILVRIGHAIRHGAFEEGGLQSTDSNEIEEDLCLLWDLTTDPSIVRYVCASHGVQLVSALIRVLATSRCAVFRLFEVAVGVVANIASSGVDYAALIAADASLVSILPSLIDLPDAPTVTEVFRFLDASLAYSEGRCDDTWECALFESGGVDPLRDANGQLCDGSDGADDELDGVADATPCLRIMSTLANSTNEPLLVRGWSVVSRLVWRFPSLSAVHLVCVPLLYTLAEHVAEEQWGDTVISPAASAFAGIVAAAPNSDNAMRALSDCADVLGSAFSNRICGDAMRGGPLWDDDVRVAHNSGAGGGGGVGNNNGNNSGSSFERAGEDEEGAFSRNAACDLLSYLVDAVGSVPATVDVNAVVSVVLASSRCLGASPTDCESAVRCACTLLQHVPPSPEVSQLASDCVERLWAVWEETGIVRRSEDGSGVCGAMNSDDTVTVDLVAWLRRRLSAFR